MSPCMGMWGWRDACGVSVTQAPNGLEGCSLGKQEAMSEKGAGAGRSRLGRWNVGAQAGCWGGGGRERGGLGYLGR